MKYNKDMLYCTILYSHIYTDTSRLVPVLSYFLRLNQLINNLTYLKT